MIACLRPCLSLLSARCTASGRLPSPTKDPFDHSKKSSDALPFHIATILMVTPSPITKPIDFMPATPSSSRRTQVLALTASVFSGTTLQLGINTLMRAQNFSSQVQVCLQQGLGTYHVSESSFRVATLVATRQGRVEQQHWPWQGFRTT